MSSLKQLLLSALTSGGAERKLLAPLLCAAAAETAGLTAHEFLHNATKLANTLRDLQRSLGLDVLVPESGFIPEWEPSRRTVLLEALKRLKQMAGDKAVIAVAIQGPQKMSAASAGQIDLDEAAHAVLENTRSVCEHGADLVWIMENGDLPPQDAEDYAALMSPVWGTIRFYQAVPALHLRGAADGWLNVLQDGLDGVLPCFDPGRSPALCQTLVGGVFGVIVSCEDDPPSDETVRFARAPGCALLTSDADWEGLVPARDFQARISQWKKMIQP
jgi:hypothetical protein